MGLLLPRTTQSPPNKIVPHPEPEPLPGDLTPENGLYSVNSSPVQPETVTIPEPENQMTSPMDIDICKSMIMIYKIFIWFHHI